MKRLRLHILVYILHRTLYNNMENTDGIIVESSDVESAATLSPCILKGFSRILTGDAVPNAFFSNNENYDRQGSPQIPYLSRALPQTHEHLSGQIRDNIGSDQFQEYKSRYQKNMNSAVDATCCSDWECGSVQSEVSEVLVPLSGLCNHQQLQETNASFSSSNYIMNSHNTVRNPAYRETNVPDRVYYQNQQKPHIVNAGILMGTKSIDISSAHKEELCQPSEPTTADHHSKIQALDLASQSSDKDTVDFSMEQPENKTATDTGSTAAKTERNVIKMTQNNFLSRNPSDIHVCMPDDESFVTSQHEIWTQNTIVNNTQSSARSMQESDYLCRDSAIKDTSSQSTMDLASLAQSVGEGDKTLFQDNHCPSAATEIHSLCGEASSISDTQGSVSLLPQTKTAMTKVGNLSNEGGICKEKSPMRVVSDAKKARCMSPNQMLSGNAERMSLYCTNQAQPKRKHFNDGIPNDADNPGNVLQRKIFGSFEKVSTETPKELHTTTLMTNNTHQHLLDVGKPGQMKKKTSSTQSSKAEQSSLQQRHDEELKTLENLVVEMRSSKQAATENTSHPTDILAKSLKTVLTKLTQIHHSHVSEMKTITTDLKNGRVRKSQKTTLMEKGKLLKQKQRKLLQVFQLHKELVDSLKKNKEKESSVNSKGKDTTPAKGVGSTESTTIAHGHPRSKKHISHSQEPQQPSMLSDNIQRSSDSPAHEDFANQNYCDKTTLDRTQKLPKVLISLPDDLPDNSPGLSSLKQITEQARTQHSTFGVGNRSTMENGPTSSQTQAKDTYNPFCQVTRAKELGVENQCGKTKRPGFMTPFKTSPNDVGDVPTKNIERRVLSPVWQNMLRSPNATKSSPRTVPYTAESPTGSVTSHRPMENDLPSTLNSDVVSGIQSIHNSGQNEIDISSKAPKQPIDNTSTTVVDLTLDDDVATDERRNMDTTTTNKVHSLSIIPPPNETNLTSVSHQATNVQHKPQHIHIPSTAAATVRYMIINAETSHSAVIPQRQVVNESPKCDFIKPTAISRSIVGNGLTNQNGNSKTVSTFPVVSKPPILSDPSTLSILSHVNNTITELRPQWRITVPPPPSVVSSSPGWSTKAEYAPLCRPVTQTVRMKDGGRDTGGRKMVAGRINFTKSRAAPEDPFVATTIESGEDYQDKIPVSGVRNKLTTSEASTCGIIYPTLKELLDSGDIQPGENVLSLHTPKTTHFGSVLLAGVVRGASGERFPTLIKWCSSLPGFINQRSLKDSTIYEKVMYKGKPLAIFKKLSLVQANSSLLKPMDPVTTLMLNCKTVNLVSDSELFPASQLGLGENFWSCMDTRELIIPESLQCVDVW